MNQLCFLSGLTSEQWAAWVQAIGSLIAIAAAIGIGRHQAVTSRNLAREQVAKTDQMQVALHAQRYAELYSPPIAIAEIAMQEMKDLLDELVAPYFKGGFNVSHALTQRCDALIEVFSAIPLHHMPTVPSVKHLWNIKKLLGDTKLGLTEIGAKKDMLTTITGDDIQRFRVSMQGIQSECDALRKNLVVATMPIPSTQ